MSGSDAGVDPDSKPRVGLLFFMAANGFVPGERSLPPRMSRRRWLPSPAVMTSMLSGASFESHGVCTWLVPTDEDPPDSQLAGSAAAEGLRSRRSTEVNRPLVWNRLLDHGVDSIVVGSPFLPGDRPEVEERSVHRGFGVMQPGYQASTEEKFTMLAESRDRRPNARFVFLGLNAEGDVPDGEGSEEEGVSAPTPGRVVEEMAARFIRVAELDHLLVISMNPMFEWVTYHGGRTLGKSRRLRLGSVFSTIFDLLELPQPLDVVIPSLLQIGDEADESTHEPEVRWLVPGGEEVGAPDFEPLLDRVRQGEAGPITRRVGRQIFKCRWDQAFDVSSTSRLDEASRDLLLASDEPDDHARRLIALACKKDVESFAAARALLHERHPGTMVDRLVDLLPTSAVTDEARLAILDEVPVKTVRSIPLRGVWAKAAIRLGRTDVGLSALWQRIQMDAASRQEMIIFANGAIERSEDGDLKRARIALGRAIEGLQGPERRSNLFRRIARTFELEGDVNKAIGMLERFLARHPEEIGATQMLGRLRRLKSD